MITIDPPSSLPPGFVPGASPRGAPEAPSEGGVRAAERKLLRGLRDFLRRAQELSGVSGEVSVLLTDDVGMRRLNRQFRGKNKSTDVLSFPVERLEGLPAEMQGGGDLAISLPIAVAQAERFGHGLETELRVLLLHGLLHLAGYDHETDAGEMAERELNLRRRFRLPGGLIDRTGHLLSAEAKARPARRA